MSAGSLPQSIPPQTASFGKADASGNVTIDLTWYLLFYNLSHQVLSAPNGTVAASPVNMLSIDDSDSASIPDQQPSSVTVDPADIDAVGADVAKLRAALQSFQSLVADIVDGATSVNGGDVIGPAGATSGNVALFDGATGKLIKDGGTLGTAAFTASTAYDAAGAAAAITPAWTTPVFSAGDFTGSGSMTWTVASGNVGTHAYVILNKTMIVSFVINSTAVGGTPANTLQIAIPDSKIAAKDTYNAIGVIIDNGVRTTGTVVVSAGGTLLLIQRTDVANWTASASTTTVRGQITFEIQ